MFRFFSTSHLIHCTTATSASSLRRLGLRSYACSSPLFEASTTSNLIDLSSVLTEKGHIVSESKWNWNFCKQFAELAPNPTLDLPTGTAMTPSAQVFSNLEIDDKILLKPPTDGSAVFKHCNIEKVMNDMKLPTMSDGAPDPEVLKDNERMVTQLSAARCEQFSLDPRETVINQCAQFFLILCGFADHPFKITSKKWDFRIFGKDCTGIADQYVVITPYQDLVLIFENKMLEEDVSIKTQGHLGQIIGEMLQVLSHNCDLKAFRSVFAVQFINYRVTGFRVDPDKKLLTTLVETQNVPNKKLQLFCTRNFEEEPLKSRGLSLIDRDERVKSLQMMADVRNFILSQPRN